MRSLALLSLLLAPLALTSGLHAQDVVATDPVGAMRITINGPTTAGKTQLTLISATFVQPVEWEGAVTTVTASGVTVTDADWTADQFNGSAEYYVEVIDGPGAGAMADIVDTMPTSLVLSDDLTAFAGADTTIRIRRHTTLADIFGANNSAGLRGGDSLRNADQVMILDTTTRVTSSYFYGDFAGTTYDGWYNASFANASQQVVLPEQAILVRRTLPSDVSFVYAGQVKLGQTKLPVQPGVNYLGMVHATGMTLGTSNLYTGNSSTGVTGGDSIRTSDEIGILNENGQYSTYFYGDFAGTAYDGWYDSAFNPANDVELAPGSGIYLRRRNGVAFNWTVPSAL